MIVGSKEWLELQRAGVFDRRPPVVAEPPSAIPVRFGRGARVPRSILREIFQKARGVCTYCRRITTMDPGPAGSLTATVDHIIPVSKGGAARDRANLALACAACNNLKADMLPAEWEAFMADRPRWWLRGARPRPAARKETFEEYDWPWLAGLQSRSIRHCLPDARYFFHMPPKRGASQ